LSTKAEQLQWRRSKVIEMRSRGLKSMEKVKLFIQKERAHIIQTCQLYSR